MTLNFKSSAPTPGPWVFDPVERVVFDAPVKLGVALVQESTTPEETLANGFLIAAAPDLLDALDYLLAETVDIDLAQGIELNKHEREAYERAIAAMAKAEPI